MTPRVRVTTKPVLGAGRPPTTVADLLASLASVAARLRGDAARDIIDFISFVEAAPAEVIRGLIDTQSPTVQWIDRLLTNVHRRVTEKVLDPSFDDAIANVTTILRGEKMLR